MKTEKHLGKHTSYLIPHTSLCLCLLLLNGCMSGGAAAKVVTALGRDPASVRARIPTPWGVIEIERTAPNSNSPPHSVSSEGVEVRAGQ